MELRKRLEEIDSFFDSMSYEKFDEILECNGMGTIKSSEECGMQLLLDNNIINKMVSRAFDNTYRSNKNNQIKEHNYNEYQSEEFLAEAV